MEIEIIWNSANIPKTEKMEIESNLRNEITNSYGDFEIASNKALVSLHKDSRSNSIIGAVIGDNGRIDMTISYSLENNHSTTYTQKHENT
jgi:RNase P/RNase MRP subunit POP5